MEEKKLVIEKMYAFVSEDPTGEGVMAMNTAMGWMPMVGADMDRVMSLIPMADKISELTERPYKILSFDNRVDVTEEFRAYMKNKEKV